MAKSDLVIRFHSVGHYRGVELLSTVMNKKIVFVAWMEKFYSSENPAALYELIDAWWTLRAN